MKGPGLRLDLDVRRVWRCEKCGRIARTPGQVTAQRCGCTEPPQWMHLELPVKKEPFKAPIREHLPEAWEIDEAAAAKSTMLTEPETAGNPDPPAADRAPQAAEQPDPGSQPAVVTEIIATEIIEVVAEVQPPGTAAPAADEFGTGIDDSQQKADQT